MTVPSVRCAQMLHEMKYSAIDQAYEKVMEDRAREHAQEIEPAAIRTWIGILCVKVIELERDAIYLLCDHRV